MTKLVTFKSTQKLFLTKAANFLKDNKFKLSTHKC